MLQHTYEGFMIKTNNKILIICKLRSVESGFICFDSQTVQHYKYLPSLHKSSSKYLQHQDLTSSRSNRHGHNLHTILTMCSPRSQVRCGRPLSDDALPPREPHGTARLDVYVARSLAQVSCATPPRAGPRVPGSGRASPAPQTSWPWTSVPLPWSLGLADHDSAAVAVQPPPPLRGLQHIIDNQQTYRQIYSSDNHSQSDKAEDRNNQKALTDRKSHSMFVCFCSHCLQVNSKITKLVISK